MKNIYSRYIYSIVGNILRLGCTMIVGLLVARTMGPEDFGRYTFITVIFTSVIQLTDFSMSKAFYTFKSGGEANDNEIVLILAWNIIQFSIIFVTLLILPTELLRYFINEDRYLLCLAFLALFFRLKIWELVCQLFEVLRETVKLQKLFTLIVCLHLVAIVTINYFNFINIYNLFYSILIAWTFGSIVASVYLLNQNNRYCLEVINTNILSRINYYYKYCLPLVPYMFLVFASEFADRYLLNLWGGNIEQGYFSLAKQFSIISLVATTSILAVFWREVSALHQKDCSETLQRFVSSTSKVLFLLTAIISCFLIPWSEKLLIYLVGTEYLGGLSAFVLMLIYPIHQVIGQIAGTFLMATGRTQTQTIFGSVTLILGIVFSYFVLAPKDAFIPGLSLASDGLALKLVILQFMFVNFLCLIIKVKYKVKILGIEQVTIPFVLIGLAYLLKILITNSFGISLLPSIFLCGILYLIVLGIILKICPQLIGVTTNEQHILISKLPKI